MERKRNVKNHDSHGQQRHRPRDAYELYELEHMPRTLQTKVSSIDRAKPREDDTFKPHYYETGRTVHNSWSQTKDGHQRHRPRDAYELYELEHMPRTLPQVKVSSTDHRAKPRDQYEVFKPKYNETGRTVQNYYGSGECQKENIDCAAEAFIRLEHEKFELSKWMSMNGY
ncbi:hypothetical protein Salat_1278300 [Sesamum alatum]|uniref:Uncharacterized protein n=1 Tax=Sesamum alatum TaxID=300844 RepID=A0AAE1YGV7_9LAMI|nr:hypothetical protein Salat_1278300 [Sesamum alatum]